MWERFARRSANRSKDTALAFGTLEKVRGRFGRQKTRQAQLPFSPAVRLGVIGVALAMTIALLLLLLRRRAARQGSSTEEANEEASPE